MIDIRKSMKRPYHRCVFGGNPSVGKTTQATVWCKNGLWFDLDDRIPDDVPQQDIIESVDKYSSFKSKLSEIKDMEVSEFTWDGIVIDTFTIVESFCRDNSVQVDFNGNMDNYADYSKGDKNFLPNHINSVLSLLDQIAKKFECDIVLICHSIVKPEKNPNGENYDKIKLDLTDKVRQRILQWADLVSFAYDEVSVVQEGLGKKATGFSNRKVSFSNDPRFDAKGDAKIPRELPFDKEGKWADEVKAIVKTAPKRPKVEVKKQETVTKPRKTQL